MVERLLRLMDGFRGADPQTGLALAAVGVKRAVRPQGQVGEHRHQPDPGPVPRGDQQVAAPQPAQTGQDGDLFMGQVGDLFSPVEDLRGGQG
jgi:hypothetical protein